MSLEVVEVELADSSAETTAPEPDDASEVAIATQANVELRQFQPVIGQIAVAESESSGDTFWLRMSCWIAAIGGVGWAWLQHRKQASLKLANANRLGQTNEAAS